MIAAEGFAPPETPTCEPRRCELVLDGTRCPNLATRSGVRVSFTMRGDGPTLEREYDLCESCNAILSGPISGLSVTLP